MEGERMAALICPTLTGFQSVNLYGCSPLFLFILKS
jgi:hypothetical protein